MLDPNQARDSWNLDPIGGVSILQTVNLDKCALILFERGDAKERKMPLCMKSFNSLSALLATGNILGRESCEAV